MGEWFDALVDDAWLWWTAGAMVLGILEITSLDLVFMMLAGGALAGALAAGLGLGYVGQVLVAAAVAGVLALTVRPVLLRRLRMPPQGTTGSAALVGRPALALGEVTPRGGLVKLVGETWSARAAPGTRFAEGDDVVVIAIDGATAVVGPSDAPSGPPAPPPGAPRALHENPEED